MRLAWMGAFALVTLLACGTAQAQGKPYLETVVELDPNVAEPIQIEPSADGKERARVAVLLHLQAKYFACPADAQITVTPAIAYDGEWGGASMEPDNVHIVIPSAKPGAEDWNSTVATTILDVFWGENRPRANASVAYVITTHTKGAAACIPAPTPIEATFEITLVGDDLQEPTTSAPLCEAADCDVPAGPPSAGSPGFELGILGLGGLAAVFFRRR